MKDVNIDHTLINGKKILFICIEFYNYHINICQKMEELGSDVEFFPERPNTKLYKLITYRTFQNFKVFIKMRRKIQLNHEEYIYEQTKNKRYDFIFLIGGKHLSREFLSKIKTTHARTPFIRYMWDPLSFFDNYRETSNIFDKEFSFDRKDCQINKDLNYLPLFYMDNFVDIENISDEDIDILFVGTYHSDRFYVIDQVKKEAKKYNLKCHIHLYISYMAWLKLKFLSKTSVPIVKDDFSFYSLSDSDIVSLTSKAKSVLDIHIPIQTGLTIRTFETLKLGKKLITTNDSIVKESFYNTNCISILNRKNVKLDPDFFTKTCSFETNKFDKYSLQNWILSIFGDK